MDVSLLTSSCLNPFEVREVLQVEMAVDIILRKCLNPFEVREVLQEDIL